MALAKPALLADYQGSRYALVPSLVVCEGGCGCCNLFELSLYIPYALIQLMAHVGPAGSWM